MVSMLTVNKRIYKSKCIHSTITCTVKSIAFKSSHTCADEAAICISTVCIGMAWVHLQCTLIDICRVGTSQIMHAYFIISRQMHNISGASLSEICAYTESDVQHRKSTELFYAIIPTLFPFFLLICYPYISLHF